MKYSTGIYVTQSHMICPMKNFDFSTELSRDSYRADGYGFCRIYGKYRVTEFGTIRKEMGEQTALPFEINKQINPE